VGVYRSPGQRWLKLTDIQDDIPPASHCGNTCAFGQDNCPRWVGVHRG
jgi:hypothetical protein